MPDLNSDALGIWEHLKPAIDKEIEQKTRGMVQRRKMKVTTAPSIATGKIGVTEAFGTTEMVIPFATNLISATVGDMVWVEFMYGATNAFASMFASADEKDWDVAGDLSVGGNAGIGGNLDVSGATSLQHTTVYGVLDVTQRRCEATLPTSGNGAGWYRVMKYSASSASIAIGGVSFVVDFVITRAFNNTNNETHRISLIADHNNISFVDETSKSNAVAIDKIRYMVNGSDAYVDIHYDVSVSNYCYVDMDVYTYQGYKGNFASVGFSAVGPSPSGETEFANYTFVSNTNKAVSFTPSVGTEDFGGCWYSLCNDLVTVSVGLTGLTNGTPHTIYTLPSNLWPKDQACAVGSGATYTTYPGLFVRSDGKIQVYVPSGGLISAVVTYMRKQ